MAVFAAAYDMRCSAKALKMGAESTRSHFSAINSWEKELAAHSCALFPGDILLRNSNETPPDRNKSRGRDPAS